MSRVWWGLKWHYPTTKKLCECDLIWGEELDPGKEDIEQEASSACYYKWKYYIKKCYSVIPSTWKHYTKKPLQYAFQFLHPRTGHHQTLQPSLASLIQKPIANRKKKTIQSMKYFNSVYHCDFINSIKIKPVANYAYRSIVGNAFDTSSSTRGSSMKFGLDRQVKGVDPTLQYHYISCLTHNCLDRTGSIFLKNIRRNTRN